MTNDIEGRLTEAFKTEAGMIQPHHDAYPANQQRLRRTRIRRRVLLPAAAVATAGAAIAPVTVMALTGAPEPGDDVTSPGPGVPRSQGDPTQLVSASTIVRIGGRLPGGAVFRVDALGTDGTVLGRSADSTVWRASGKGGAPAPLGIRAQGGLSIGPGTLTWIEPRSFDLRCRSADGTTHVISPQSADAGWPVRVSGGVLVWHDIMRQPFVAKGCAAPGRFVPSQGKPVLGHAMAFSYPSLFAVEPANDRVLREINVDTGRMVAERPLPAGVKVQTMADQDQKWYAAANPRVFAWVAGDLLRVTDRATWKRPFTPLSTGAVNQVRGGQATLTAGNRVIVYSAASPRGEGESILYDTQTRQVVRWHGPAYAAGDWLLWRDGRDYRLARVR